MPGITATSVDEKFMQKLLDTIEQEMSRPDLRIEELAADMNMSRASLNRKIKALTNQSPGIMLRLIGLEKPRSYLRPDLAMSRKWPTKSVISP